MATIFNDDLRIIVSSMPPSMKSGDNRQNFKAFLARWADNNPEYFLAPITSNECAALLGITPQALRNRRCRGAGPPGYIEPANGKGSGTYQNRLVILKWVDDQLEAEVA
jgi:hypothetical protein